MANEIGPYRYTSGASLVCTVTNDAGQVWSRGASNWVAADTAVYADCTIAMAEQGTTGRYYASLPVSSNLDLAGRYSAAISLASASGFDDMQSLLGEGVIDASVGSRSSHSAADVAALILADPTRKLATDAGGRVAANMTQIAGRAVNDPGAAVTVPQSIASADVLALVKARTDTIGATGTLVVSAVGAGGTITVYAGDEYTSLVTNTIDLNLAEIDLTAFDSVELRDSWSNWEPIASAAPADAHNVTFSIDHADSARLAIGSDRRTYRVVAIKDGDLPRTVREGALIVK